MIAAKKIDEIDAKILKDLLIDGRKELRDIAEEAQVSKDVIWQHFNSMRKEGIIVGSTIQLNYAALGYNVSASFFVDTPPSKQRQVSEQLQKIPGLQCNFQWGSHSKLWAVSDFLRAEQINNIRQLIINLPSVLKVEVEIWTGNRNQPENLSLLNINETSNDTEKTEIKSRKRIKETAVEIDEIDRQIIDKLAVDGRAAFSTIGKELRISTNTTIRRYNKLERNGIVRALIQINPAKIGYSISACFRLRVGAQGDAIKIAEKISKIPDVYGVLMTTGDYNLNIFTEMKDIEHFVALEKEIASIPDIQQSETPSLNRFPIFPYPREHISTF